MLVTRRFTPLFLALALLLTPAFSAVALAQDAQDAPAYCAEVGLSAADCTLLADSQAAMTGVQAVTTYAELDFLVSGIPDLPFNELAVNYTQDTALAQGEVATATAQKLRAMTPQQRFQFFMDQQSLVDVMSETIYDTNIDTELTLIVSEEIQSLIAAEAGMPVPNTITFGIRIVDGVEYLNISDLATLAPELAFFGDGWIGIEMEPLLQQAYGQGGTFDQQAGDEGRLLLAQMMSMPALWNGSSILLHTLGTTPEAAMALKFFNIVREDDDKVNGQDVAVFRTTIDYQTLLSDPMIQDLIKAILADEEFVGQDFSEAEIEQIMTAVQLFGPAVLQSLTLELVETVGLQDGFAYSGEFNFDWDLTQLMALAAASGGEVPDVAPAFSINMLTISDNFNQPQPIEAPANAFILPPELLEQ